MRITSLAAASVLWLAVFSSAHAVPRITVTDSYSPPTLAGTTGGVVFFTIRSEEEDKLVGVSTPAARVAEIHNHIADENGVLRMRRVVAVNLNKGKTIEFKSGGLHIMLFDVKKPLAYGDTLPLTLTFEKAKPLTLAVPVVDKSELKPAPDAHSHH